MTRGGPMRVTERAQRAVLYARSEASRLGHDRVGTEHLLLALLRDEDCLAVATLGKLGIPPETVRRRVEETVGPGQGERGMGFHLPMTKPAALGAAAGGEAAWRGPAGPGASAAVGGPPGAAVAGGLVGLVGPALRGGLRHPGAGGGAAAARGYRRLRGVGPGRHRVRQLDQLPPRLRHGARHPAHLRARAAGGHRAAGAAVQPARHHAGGGAAADRQHRRSAVGVAKRAAWRRLIRAAIRFGNVLLARLARLRYELVNRWNEAVGRLGGTLLDRTTIHPESEIVGVLGRMEEALAWENGEWDRLRERLLAAAIRSPERPDVHALRKLVTILSIAQMRFDERDWTRRLNDLWAYLRAGEQAIDASPLWQQLRSALRDRDLAGWDDARAEATRLAGIQGEVEALEALASRLSLAAPQWAALIVETGGDEQRCGDPILAGQAWRWRQAETWLAELLHGDDPAELQRRLEAGLQRVGDLTTRLAAASAWLAVGEQLTDAQRRSLTKWAQALQKVGKGTGKYAPRWRAEAQQAMQQARGAVPVWVMPAYRAVESFDPADEPFDVVIIDESSQCDVFALALLGIARKAVVVGDDKQISPQAVGVDQEAVHQLIAQHLRGIPDAAMLDVTSSLYDVAKRTFPGVIMLKEHFAACLRSSSSPTIWHTAAKFCLSGRRHPTRAGGQWSTSWCRTGIGRLEAMSTLRRRTASSIRSRRCAKTRNTSGKRSGSSPFSGRLKRSALRLSSSPASVSGRWSGAASAAATRTTSRAMSGTSCFCRSWLPAATSALVS